MLGDNKLARDNRSKLWRVRGLNEEADLKDRSLDTLVLVVEDTLGAFYSRSKDRMEEERDTGRLVGNKDDS